MRVRASQFMALAVLAASSVALMCGAAFLPSSGTPSVQNSGSMQASAIKIDYPLDGSVFPPEITPPTFLWHDANETSKRWVFEISFAGTAATLRIDAPGDLI